ncbi:MAG: DNA polymerase/3'-5' exonuclease PolX [Candidatus Omnitrophota bacterium]|nr:DNA polymerase/3'-5' exonuclease PolX [Candidatus Omnitrophota bacterium]
MKNIEIATIFRKIANILEIKADNPFRIRAYERAAQNLEGLTEDLETITQENRLQQIPGIGKDLESKIKEFLQTGKIKFYEDLQKTIPLGLLEILNIPSVGPKTAKLLYENLKIKNIEDLEKKAKTGKLIGLPNIQQKTVENILRGIEILKKGKERMHLAMASNAAEEFMKPLGKLSEVKKISVAGSLRRMKETVRDIDILIVSTQPKKIMDVFSKLTPVKQILAKGETKSSVLTKDNIQVDLRVVEAKSFGAALLYFTGSKNFNIRLRQLALKKQLKINEYGIFSMKGKTEKYLAGKTEEEIFKQLGMDYVVPELREDNGEIELALKGEVPKLIELKDIKGDFHCHSIYSDGGNSISEMAEVAIKKGYKYIALTDHSQSLKVANGLNLADLKRKKEEIERLNKNFKDFRILFGTEIEIDKNGDLDYKEKTLSEFDIVVAAIHSGFKQSKEQLTKRIVKACRNKYVDIIAHPTGILWGTRYAYELNFDEVFKVASDTGTFLEINAFPNRLDLNDIHCRRAKELGVKLAVGTDAHTSEQLNMMNLGIAVARRGWLSKEDVVNCLPLEELRKVMKK